MIVEFLADEICKEVLTTVIPTCLRICMVII